MRRFALPLLMIPIWFSSAFPQQKSCDKPYEVGRLTVTHTEPLRPIPPPANRKELKRLGKNIDDVQRQCNAFVRANFNQAVSKDFLFTVDGFGKYVERCESFCGTQADLARAYGESAVTK